jgi:hypothetical protein
MTSTLREGLCTPRRDPDAFRVVELRAFLDGQSRIHLAGWVSHEHRLGNGEVDHDDHLLLGIDDADWQRDGLWALELGLNYFELPTLDAWLDLFSMAEAADVRRIGSVLWEREAEPSPELDPLDYTLTWEPLELEADAVAAFAGLVRHVPGVVRIEACRERLWKADEERRVETRLFVGFDERRPHDFEQIRSAMSEAGIDNRTFGISASLPSGPQRTAVLYER